MSKNSPSPWVMDYGGVVTWQSNEYRWVYGTSDNHEILLVHHTKNSFNVISNSSTEHHAAAILRIRDSLSKVQDKIDPHRSTINDFINMGSISLVWLFWKYPDGSVAYMRDFDPITNQIKMVIPFGVTNDILQKVRKEHVKV